MAYYFLVDTNIDKNKNREEYNSYIEKVKPIVEKFNGEYVVRKGNAEYLSDKIRSQRVIITKFPDRKSLKECLDSEEYKAIERKRKKKPM